MASVANVSDLPYHLPTDTIGQAKALASILEVSPEDGLSSISCEISLSNSFLSHNP